MINALIIAVVLAVMLTAARFAPYDSTDDITNSKRSGLSIYTDHATGVQYVKAGIFGGTVVRVDINGKPYSDATPRRTTP